MSPIVAYILVLLVLLASTGIVLGVLFNYKFSVRAGIGKCTIAKATRTSNTIYVAVKNTCSRPVHVRIIGYGESTITVEETLPANTVKTIEMVPGLKKIVVYESGITYGLRP